MILLNVLSKNNIIINRQKNIFSSDYIKYESNGDRNRTLSIEEHLDEIKPCLEEIINNPKKSDTAQVESVKC